MSRGRHWTRSGKGAMPAFVLGLLLVVACAPTDRTTGPVDVPPPRNLEVYYFNQAVHLRWELDPGWDGETFRIYGKRVTDPEYFLVAEVTSCAAGLCSYVDPNVVAGVSYEYYVAAVDPLTGFEAATEVAIEVSVPQPIPPPVPGDLVAIALDGAVFLAWGQQSREAGDFAYYRVYLEQSNGMVFLLGETDSEGFLDLLADNGNTYGYFVTAVDDQGHESEGSQLAFATPRPDFHGELLFAFSDVPELSGFRFQETEADNPILPGHDDARDFRLEVDEAGWWLVPGPGAQVHQERVFTTALRCGPAADLGCLDLRTAPATGYTGERILLVPEYSYVLRVPADAGGWMYGLVRVSHVGFVEGGAIAIFDWAFQLQVGNRALTPGSS
jgi:hypothetical protein